MRRCFNLVALLLGGIVLVGCTSNLTSTVRVGFDHTQLVNELDGTATRHL